MFSPDPAEVAFARKILEAMPDGSGAVMIDGKMQDDATWKQAKVLVDLARAGRRQGPRSWAGARPIAAVPTPFALASTAAIRTLICSRSSKTLHAQSSRSARW